MCNSQLYFQSNSVRYRIILLLNIRDEMEQVLPSENFEVSPLF